jgi:ribosomal protein S18 acetylase RimI-like enzyme
VLSVSEANEAARELYRSVGFRQAARFVVMERKR